MSIITYKWTQRIHQLLLIALAASSFSSILAMEEHIPGDQSEHVEELIDTATQEELEKMLQGFEGSIDMGEIDQLSQEVENDLKKREKDHIRNNNRILWSIPAAFPESEFDEKVNDLHVKIPLYGKISLGDDAYGKYKKYLEKVQKAYGAEDFSYFVDGAQRGVNLWQENLDVPLPGIADTNEHVFKNAYAPGLRSALTLNEYLTGKKIVGVGLYRSDLNEAAFLAGNMASGYLLYRDIMVGKLDTVKSYVTNERKEIIGLLERLQTAKDKKESEKIKKELRAAITKQCSLFAYNPFKKEVIWPIIKYIMIQRVIENIKAEKPHFGAHTDPDQFDAFVKNDQGEFERSGVRPVSAVSISKFFLAPLSQFSETSKETVFKVGKQLKFMDRFFGRVHLPLECYRLLASVIGEGLVLVMAVKIMDRYLNNKMADALIAKPDAYLSLLQEGDTLLSIAYPTTEEAEKIGAYEEKLEKEIKRALSAGKSGFFSWIAAKRATFMKITQMGFLCFVLPSLLIKGAPLLFKIIKSINWRS